MAEERRVAEAWARGQRVRPAFVYRPSPNLDDISSVLHSMVESVSRAGPWGELYADRASELLAEARIVRSIGFSASMLESSACRYPSDASPQHVEAEARACAWVQLRPKQGEPSYTSDDEREPSSLLSLMRATVGALRLALRVEVSENLPCYAAAGDGVVLIRGGVRHRRRDAERIVVHEIEGHVLPRLRAMKHGPSLWLAGTAGGADDEEGRALLLEIRSGWMDERRKAALGRRHLAALAVRQGADFPDVVDLARGWGEDLAEALWTAFRVTRGGGLGRELVYLPALLRVEQALAVDADLERWMERGRVSVAAARVLRRLGAPPDRFGFPTAA